MDTVLQRPVHRLDPTQVILGREITLSLANGEKRRARFALVAAAALLASHNERTFALTPGYPTLPDGRSVNDRNYAGDRNAQSEVLRMAQHLDAARMITTSRTSAGSPIITTDGVVVSGNNRTMSLKLAIGEFPEQYAEYDRLLWEEREAFGFEKQLFRTTTLHQTPGWYFHYNPDPEAPTSDGNQELALVHPVLVRIDYDFPAYSPAELAKYNQDTKKGERPVDRALKLAAQLRAHGAAARILSTELGTFDTFSEFYADSRAVRTVREALLTAGVVLPQEASTYFSDAGAFTEAGRQLIERAAAGLVLTPEALIASEAEGLGSVRQVVATSLPVLLANDKLPDDWRLTSFLSAAVVLQHKINRSATAGGPSAALGAFSAYVRTPQLDEPTPPRETMVLNRLLVAGRRAFKAALEAFNTSAEQAVGGLSMFGAVTPVEAFTGHLEKRLDADTLRVMDLVAPRSGAAAPEAAASTAPVPPSNPELGKLALTGGILPPAGEAINLLIGGNWFKLHPDKLLGTPKHVSTRFGGSGTVLTGALADALARVAAPVRHQDAAPALPVGAVAPRTVLTDNPDARAAAAKVLAKSKERVAQRSVQQQPAYAAPKATEVHSFESALHALNSEHGLSDAHHQCFAWHKQQDGDPIGGEYGRRYNMPPTEERLQRWVAMGIAVYNGRQYRYAPLFYAGNYYDRLAELTRRRDEIVATIGEASYQRQLDELSRRRPTPLTVTDPEPGRRLMLKPIAKLAKEFTVPTLINGEPFTRQKPKLRSWDVTEYETYAPTLYQTFYHWLGTLPPRSFGMGTSVHEVRTYYLQQTALPNPDNDPKVEAENTRIRQRSRVEGERLFADFLATQLTAADQQRLEAAWNATYNAWIPVELRQVPVCFRWAKTDAKGLPLDVKPEKREAVAQMLVEGAYILAYDVGVGKTFSATFALAQALEAGYCQRPLIVTPNQVYKQFIAEIKGLLPHVPVNSFYNLGTKQQAKVAAALDADGRVPAGSITVVTKEGLEQIGLRPENLQRLEGEFFTILNQGNVKGGRESEALKARLATMLGKGQRGSTYALEDFGFDFLCVDEAHSLKKSFTKVKGNVSDAGTRERNQYDIQSGEPSALALRGFCLAHYIMNGHRGRNVLLLTATPFTNSPLEVFSMLALVAYKKLEAIGQNSLVNFFDTYVNVSNQLVVTASMKLAFKQVVLGYNNLRALQQLVRRFILYKTGEDVGVERPNKIVLPLTQRRDEAGNLLVLPPDEMVLTRLPMTPLQKMLMDEVIAYADGQKDLSSLCLSLDTADNAPEDDAGTFNTQLEGAALNEEEKAGVRVLRSINMARNLALSPYLYSCSRLGTPSARDYVETSPKLRYVVACIRAVREYHQSRREPVSGQVIYMDRGVDKFPLLREYLIHEIGFQPHEVALVYSGLSADQKERIKNGYLGRRVDKDGNVTELPEAERIKVIIGSSTIKEGLNLQRWGTVLYNCFIDWNPTDVKQLEGRIWRFGNQYANVIIVNPMLENSADAFIYQKLEEKSARINEVWEQAGQENALKLEEFNPGELKMALLTDPRRAAEAQVAEDKAKAQGEVDQIKNRIQEVEELIKALPQYRDLLTKYRRYVFDLLTPEQRDRARDGWDGRDYEYIRRRHMEVLNERYSTNRYAYEFPQRATLVANQRIVDWGQAAILSAFQLREADLPTFVEQLQVERADKETQVQEQYGEAAIDRLTSQIAAQRAALNHQLGSVEDRVTSFKTLLPKLRMLAPGEKLPAPKPRRAPKYKQCPPRQADGSLAIDDEALAHLRRCLFELPSTKSRHVDAQGRYTPDRVALHERIIAKYAQGKPCVVGRPVCVLTGGLPGSGKSYLIKNSPFQWVNDEEHVIHVDADAVRAELPEYQGWNANQTHEETKDLVAGILDRVGTPCESDLVYDGTMNKLKSYLPLIEKLRHLGYELYVLFVRVPFEVSRQRVLERYQRTGRYVPIEVIQDAYNAGDEALLQIKSMVDGYVVYDGVSGQELEKGGRAIPTKREYVVAPAPTPPAPPAADRTRQLKLARAKADAQKQRVRVLQLARHKTQKLVTA